MKQYNLIGVGIGPFNLSLAALLEKVGQVSNAFFEQKSHFDWHSEVMFADSYMQTSYLKDLVTPVDPTSKFSFLNFLVQNGLFDSFMNTDRRVVSRREFEMYCQWVSKQIGERLKFGEAVREVNFDGKKFHVRTDSAEHTSEHICLGTGLSPRIVDCAKEFLGPQVFHAKSPALKTLDLTGKNLVIIGGGQTGLEVFRNGFNGRWGKPQSVKLVTRRQNLEPLDETAFTNEYFTSNYVHEFWNVNSARKAQIVGYQKLASDGNTPSYLAAVYNDLYRLKYIDGQDLDVGILAYRRMKKMRKDNGRYLLTLENGFLEKSEEISADVVILCTGFLNNIPAFIEPLRPKIHFDSEGRFDFHENFAIQWDGPDANRIYALNFSRHMHGISEPQTSLMSWRSATIINDILGEKFYLTTPSVPNFVRFT